MTVNAVVSEVTEVADALIVIGPARAPVTLLETTPPEAVAVPRPVTVPAPLVFANVTTVPLSLATRLPPASRISTVSVRVFPEARSVVELMKARWSAAPATTVNVVESEVSELAVAVIVIEPASPLVTVCDATPPDAVAVPSPVMVPAPPVFANVTAVVLSPATRLPPASRTSAVTVRVVPDLTLAVELVKVRWSAEPATTVNVFEPDVNEAAVAVIVVEPASPPVTVCDATPPDAVAVVSPVTVPAPLVFANVTLVELSPISWLPAASRTSTVSPLLVAAARPAVELVNVR